MSILFINMLLACYLDYGHSHGFLSFRVDDVQAWWCSGVVLRSVLDILLGEDIPVTLGIVAAGLSTDPTLVDYLNDLLSRNDSAVEVANHSYKHDNFAGMTLAAQTEDMWNTNAIIHSLLNISPTTFLAPYNNYDHNTLLAMKANNMSLLSAQCAWGDNNRPANCVTGSEVVAPQIYFQGVAMMPAGAVLGGIEYWKDFMIPGNAQLAFEWIDRQIENQGFSVLMLHPSEFALPYSSCGVVNHTKLSILREVVQYGKSKKWHLMTMQDAAALMVTDITNSPTAVPSISSQPTISPTTKDSQHRNWTPLPPMLMSIVLPIVAGVVVALVMAYLWTIGVICNPAAAKVNHEQEGDVEKGPLDGESAALPSFQLTKDSSDVTLIHPQDSPSTAVIDPLHMYPALNDRWIIEKSNIEVPQECIIGKGGYGVVRKAFWRDGNRTYVVALKETEFRDKSFQDIHLCSDSSLSSIESVRREAQLMVSLRSPFIVQLLGICPPNFLVMELMTHGSLLRWIQQRSLEQEAAPLNVYNVRTSMIERFQFMQDIIRGVEYLHGHNVIHRDLKSPNILLSEEGGALKAKIADFGMARLSTTDIGATTADQAMSLLWAAPEQLQERPLVSKAMDIYAFGVIMWELVALKVPHAGRSVGSIVTRTLSGNRETIPSSCPLFFSNIITRSWAQNPGNRPTALELMEELLNTDLVVE